RAGRQVDPGPADHRQAGPRGARDALAGVVAGPGRVEGQHVGGLRDVDADAAEVLRHLVERRSALLVPRGVVLQDQAELAEGLAVARGRAAVPRVGAARVARRAGRAGTERVRPRPERLVGAVAL